MNKSKINKSKLPQVVDDTLPIIKEGGTAIRTAEISAQQMVAIKRPRNEVIVMESSMQELELMPDFAEKAYYTIPYKSEGGKIVNVEGPSIKAAMALGRRWGNCSSATRVISDQDDRVVVEGVFIDYETNVSTLATISVSKTAWNKKLRQYITLKPDRLNMAIQAGMSKARRNAILNSLPVYLTETYMKAAKEIATGKRKLPNEKHPESLASRVQKMYKSFEKFGVTRKMVTGYLKGRGHKDIRHEALGELLGIYNAVSDGTQRPQDIFDVQESKDQIAGPVKASDFKK